MKQVIVVRKDLNMRKGKLAAQVGHACVTSVIEYKPEIYPEVKLWLYTGMAKIVVGCESLDELKNLEVLAKQAGLLITRITDAGKTEFTEPTVTCLAIGPGEDHKIDEITGELKLL